MSYTKHIEHLFFAGVLGLISAATSYLSKINEKLDRLNMSVQEIAYKNDNKFNIIDTRLVSLERFCPLKKRL